MESSLSDWCKVKEILASSNHKPPYFKEGDVWWTCVGMNIGYEVYGKGKHFTRPVLVLKKFNKELFLGVPLSSKLKQNKYYYTFQFQTRKNSLLLSQLRVFSSSRFQSKLGEVSEQDFLKIRKTIMKTVFDN
jgi:mRNA interferase MazF